jgi:hypothetical protein
VLPFRFHEERGHWADCSTFQLSFGVWDFKCIFRTVQHKLGWVLTLSRSNPTDMTLFINSWMPVVFGILLWINYHIIIYVTCCMMLLVTSSASIPHIRVLFNVGMVLQFPPTFHSLRHMGLIQPSTLLPPVYASIHPSIHTTYPPTFCLCDVTLAR